MTIGSKVRQIRESEKLTRKDFEEKTGINWRAIEAIEVQNQSCAVEKIQAICKAYLQYTLWLMIDEIDLAAGQISPDMQY